jgi:hypothetical protein
LLLPSPVLLIACAHLNLLVARRTTARGIAIQFALGHGCRLLADSIAEGLTLAAAG